MGVSHGSFRLRHQRRARASCRLWTFLERSSGLWWKDMEIPRGMWDYRESCRLWTFLERSSGLWWKDMEISRGMWDYRESCRLWTFLERSSGLWWKYMEISRGMWDYRELCGMLTKPTAGLAEPILSWERVVSRLHCEAASNWAVRWLLHCITYVFR
jgi:hypothetical protein